MIFEPSLVPARAQPYTYLAHPNPFLPDLPTCIQMGISQYLRQPHVIQNRAGPQVHLQLDRSQSVFYFVPQENDSHSQAGSSTIMHKNGSM